MELFQALISTVYLPSTHYLSTYLQVDFYSDRYVGTNLDNPSFAEISRAMGGEGVTVTRPEEVGPALTELLATGRPGVLEVMVSRTLADPFRRDALSAPVRHLDKYKDFV